MLSNHLSNQKIMSKKQIRELVSFALSDKANLHKKLSLGKITPSKAQIIKEETKKEVDNAEIFIDTSAIRHIINQHGSIKREEKRGQIAVNIDDFELLPEILSKATEITYKGKNNLKMDVFELRYKYENCYIVLEEVRENKRGNNIYISTMYKIKGKKQ